MTYQRIMPRDIFNEADLLKCIGRLWILLDENRNPHSARIVEEEVAAFFVEQDQSSGAIHISNLTFEVDGIVHRLARPLNSRQKWPLWVETKEGDDDFESIPVFDDAGNLSDDMRSLIQEDSV